MSTGSRLYTQGEARPADAGVRRRADGCRVIGRRTLCLGEVEVAVRVVSNGYAGLAHCKREGWIHFSHRSRDVSRIEA